VKKMKKTYKVRRLGAAYAITIPKILVTEEMLRRGVRIEVLGYNGSEIIMRVRVADEHREHAENNEEDRGDTPQLGTTNSTS
jgi:antitoxin component of MazEF toxin-antitoxin module